VSSEDTRHSSRFTCQRTSGHPQRAPTRTSCHTDVRAANLRFWARLPPPPRWGRPALPLPSSALEKPPTPAAKAASQRPPLGNWWR